MKTPEELTDVLLTTLKAAPDDRTPAFLCIMVEKFIADVQAGALSAGKKAGAAAERKRCAALCARESAKLMEAYSALDDRVRRGDPTVSPTVAMALIDEATTAQNLASRIRALGTIATTDTPAGMEAELDESLNVRDGTTDRRLVPAEETDDA